MAAIQDPRHLIFHGMSEAAQQLVAECMFEQQARAGQAVIKQGEYGDIVYVVERSYEVYLEQAGDQPVASYKQADSFGELALMYSCARAATVKCVKPGLLWGLDRISYRKIVQAAHDSANNSLVAMLKACEPLKPLDSAQINALASTMQIVRCHRGQQLLRPGVPPEALYVLQSGQMSLKDGSKAGRALKPGDYFGEEALEGSGSFNLGAGGLSGSSQGLAVTAEHDCVLAHHQRVVQPPRRRPAGDRARPLQRALPRVHHRAPAPLRRRETPHRQADAEGGAATASSVVPRPFSRASPLCPPRPRPRPQVSYASGSSIVKAGGVLQQPTSSTPARCRCRAGRGRRRSRPATTSASSLFRHESAAASLVAVGQVVCMAVARDTVQRQLGLPLGDPRARGRQEGAEGDGEAIDFRALQLRGILGVGTFGTVPTRRRRDGARRGARADAVRAQVHAEGEGVRHGAGRAHHQRVQAVGRVRAPLRRPAGAHLRGRARSTC